jgi:hypothetical protein
MDRAEIEKRIREIYENAKALARCGEPAIESRASEILAMSHALVWAEIPFESINVLLEYE